MENLKRTILDSEEILMEKILKYAKENNYAKYTSTLKEAWRLSISGLSEALIKTIEKSSSIPEFGPDDDFTFFSMDKFKINLS